LNLANVLRRTDRLDEALAAARRARSIYEATLPAEHPLLARAADSETQIRDLMAAPRAASAVGPRPP
jgi:hypothetical protein